MKFWYCALTVAALCAPACAPAYALDPGTVSGKFLINGKPVELKFAYAHLHDNAEGILSRPRELRILLTDREVPPAALRGVMLLPVEQLAMEGGVQGLLFELDPAKPNSMVEVLLTKPSEEGTSLMRTTHSVEGAKLFKQWKFEPLRVVGAIDRQKEFDPDFPNLSASSFVLEFNAPVFKEPAVTADLKGPAVKTSPQMKAILEAQKVMITGNVAALRNMQSVRAAKQFELALKLQGVDAAKVMKQGAIEMKQMVTKIHRIVVRGDQAVALVGKDSWLTMVKEGGAWKMDL
ncbi:MAG: hypothetical protein K0Q72_5481 [Armatimonadetes bacterium]|nr:hypothetical protein [Armatimonadota bacterium]